MNLVDVVPGLRRVSDKEYVGPCPYCGQGTDRFVVWPQQGIKNTGRFWCRQCDNKGDLATYLSEIRGVEMKEALDIAGKPLESDGRVNLRWKKLMRETEPVEILYDREIDYTDKPTEFVLSAMTTALYRGDTDLHLHCLNILADRMKILLRVFRRYEELHRGSLDAFIASELQEDPEELFTLIGIRPGPRTLRLDHVGSWVGSNECDQGCEGDQCKHMAPFHFIPDKTLIDHARRTGDRLPAGVG